MSFSSAHPALLAALTRRGFTVPTTVQTAVLESEAGRDLLVSAQTGSGKTVAFGLGLAGPLLGDAARFGKPGPPLALVVAPTRELAQQVFRELTWLYADAGGRIATCVGGFDPQRERRALQGGVHIVVGTPGRLCDHLDRGALSLAHIEAVVLDEADEMLDMGFKEDLEQLLDATPPERRTLMFSATLPRAIVTLAKRYQRDALRIATHGDTERHGDIEYRAVMILARQRDLAVVNLLRYHDAPGALVFCRTREGVTHLAANLGERGFSVAALSGELTQRERTVALQALRDGRARVCVATDVAARGLDLPDLGLVIHADLPQSSAMLVHRSGRTGRAGRRGVATVLVPNRAQRQAERLFSGAHVEATWMPGPTVEDILAKDREQLAAEITAMSGDLEEDDRVVARQLLAAGSAEDLVATLVHQRRVARPAPEELTVPSPAGSQQDGGRSRRQQARDRPQGDRPRSRGAEARRSASPPSRTGGSRPGAGQLRGGAWFTLNIGRAKKADPKWIIPLLCRRGGITKGDIGKIEIRAKETRVEIAADVAAAFAEAVRRPDAKDANIRITPAGAAS